MALSELLTEIVSRENGRPIALLEVNEPAAVSGWEPESAFDGVAWAQVSDTSE